MGRLEQLLSADRIVIKYGTNAITKTSGSGRVLGLDKEKLDKIAWIAHRLYETEKDMIIVSSGAVVAGMSNELNQPIFHGKRPEEVCELQDLASEGQAELIMAYKAALLPYRLGVMEFLVTHHHFETEKERDNIRARVESAFRKRKIPVFNTNDTVTNRELVPAGAYNSFTDNDPMSSLVAIYCRKGKTSLIIVSENGSLGTGGSASKRAALLKAEEEGIITNLDFPVSHKMLEAAVRSSYVRL